MKNYDNEIRFFPNYIITFSPQNYSKESVLIYGDSSAQPSIPNSAEERPSQADTIFKTNILNKITSDFSQIYAIRKKGEVCSAYHLDITELVRISIARSFEIRPDDIVFCHYQALSLLIRALKQIPGSTGLILEVKGHNKIRDWQPAQT